MGLDLIIFSQNKIMKLFLIGSLSILSLISIKPAPVGAQNVDSRTSNPTLENLAPRSLIALARQGRFNAQGIPGYSNLGSAIRSGRVDAQKLVASAVAQNRLPETALQDVDYLKAVNHHLKSGGCGSL